MLSVNIPLGDFMKKLISILLALALVLAMAACARQNTNGNETESESTTSAQSTEASGADEKALISVGSADIADKSGTAIERGEQSGTAYKNDSLGIKITPPESFESFDDEAENPDNDYFVIELTENHDSITYKTVKISVTENISYSSVDDYISSTNSLISSETKLNAVGTLNIGGREYTCAKWSYPDSPEANSVNYILIENGTLVILGFDQMPDSEIADFFNNSIVQY